MGGYGSGRTGRKQIAEDCKSLDVNRLQREGVLNVGVMGNWVWFSNGEEVGRIGYSMTDAGLKLNYRVRCHGNDWEAVTETVPLTYVACHYGGMRTYFLCPGYVNGRHCGRRVGKLFAGGRYFLCRHCYSLAYRSQSEAECDRALRRANNTRMALGGEPGTAYFIAPKPKGMWQRTYERHCQQIARDEGQADILFISKFTHLLNEEDREAILEVLE